MLAIARRNAIKQLIEQHGEVVVTELSRQFNVSESTIRRDLDVLEEQNIIEKTYGGAVLHKQYLKSDEPSFIDRKQTQQDEKRLIAKLAASLVEDGDVVILDAGTTTSLMVPYLKDRQSLTVVTGAINVAHELIAYPNIEVIVLGGTLRHRTSSVIGQAAITALQSIWADKLFLSCSGVSYQGGVTVSNLVSLEIRQQMMKSASSTVLLADSTKIGKRFIAKVASLEEVDWFITNRLFEEQSRFEDSGVRVLCAESLGEIE